MFIPNRDGNGNIIFSMAPFASKSKDNDKYFRRVHGVTATLVANGDTIIDLVVPYNKCKINAAQMMWLPEGVTADFEVFDTPTGTLSTVPNLKLNQFGFGVVLAKDAHEDKSEYDADLIKDMKIRVILHNSTNTTKLVGVNFVLHEIKN